MTNEEMGNMQDHYPRRDDQVAAWIKDRRDNIKDNTPLGTHMEGWNQINALLDEYRFAADHGISLDDIVNGDHQEYQPGVKKPKPGRETAAKMIRSHNG